MNKTEKELLEVLQSAIDCIRSGKYEEFQDRCRLLIHLGRTMELEAKGWPPMPEIKPITTELKNA